MEHTTLDTRLRTSIALLRSALLCGLALVGTQTVRAQAHIGLVQLRGDHVRQGEMAEITWRMDETCLDELRLSVWDGNTNRWTTIADALPAAMGRFQWNVPENLHGDRFRLKIENLSKPSIYRMGESFFTIEEATRTSRAPEPAVTGERRVSVTPNPATAGVYMAWSGDVPERCVLRDVNGVVVAVVEQIAGKETVIDTERLAAGLYLIEASFADGGSVFEKVVVRK